MRFVYRPGHRSRSRELSRRKSTLGCGSGRRCSAAARRHIDAFGRAPPRPGRAVREDVRRESRGEAAEGGPVEVNVKILFSAGGKDRSNTRRPLRRTSCTIISRARRCTAMLLQPCRMARAVAPGSARMTQAGLRWLRPTRSGSAGAAFECRSCGVCLPPGAREQRGRAQREARRPRPERDQLATRRRPAPRASCCFTQPAGNGSNNRGRPSSGGCRPSRIASTISGASSVSRSRLPRYPRSIRSASASRSAGPRFRRSC